MSCDYTRRQWFQYAATGEESCYRLFGDNPDAARDALERIFETVKNAPLPAPLSQAEQALLRQKAYYFARSMNILTKIPEPSHSAFFRDGNGIDDLPSSEEALSLTRAYATLYDVIFAEGDSHYEVLNEEPVRSIIQHYAPKPPPPPTELDSAIEAAHQADIDILNNEAVAQMYSKLISGLTGRNVEVQLAPGQGFATDMNGTIIADPYPLGMNAAPAENMIVCLSGIQHEMGHELFTSGSDWSEAVSIAKGEREVEGLTSPAARTIPMLVNILEDGRMEHILCRDYLGIQANLHASSILDPRWDEKVGNDIPIQQQLTGCMLYEALPFFEVRNEIYERLSPQARELFDDIRPIIRETINAPTSRTALESAITIARKLQDASVYAEKPANLDVRPPSPNSSGSSAPSSSGEEDDQPKGHQPSSGGEDDQPKGRQPSSSEDDQPKGRQLSSSGEDDQPKGRQPSSSEDDQPKGRQLSSSGEDDQPKGRQLSSSGEDDQPKGRQLSSSGEDDQPKGRQPSSSDDDNDQAKGRQPSEDTINHGKSRGTEGNPTIPEAKQSALTPPDLSAMVEAMNDHLVTALTTQIQKQAKERDKALVKGVHQSVTKIDPNKSVRYRDTVTRRERSIRVFPVRVSLDAKKRETAQNTRTKVTPLARVLAKKIKRIREDVEGIAQNQTTGRFDRKRMVAAMSGDQQVYKRQVQHQAPDTSMAVSLNVDVSGSMDEYLTGGDVHEATLTIALALEELGMPYEVRAFNEHAYLIKGMDDSKINDESLMGTRSPFYGGGCEDAAFETIAMATNSLQATETANKLLFCLTDAAISKQLEAEARIYAAKQQGIIPFGIFFWPTHRSRRNFEDYKSRLDNLYGQGNWITISSLSELPIRVGTRIEALWKQLPKRKKKG